MRRHDIAAFFALLAIVIVVCVGADRPYSVTKAQAAWVAAHPNCAVCELKRIHGWRCEGHHIIPYAINPVLGDCPTNFITLCRAHHWLVGHGGRNWSYENTNVLENAHAIRRLMGLEGVP